MEITNQKNRNTIKPLIKWTGGKYDEVQEFSHLIPEFNNYYEPFFGGGGVFFSLQPKGISFVNDKSSDLIKFYISVKNNALEQQLYHYCQAWEKATLLSKEIAAVLLPTFQNFISDTCSKSDLVDPISKTINEIDHNRFTPLFDEYFILNARSFEGTLIHSLADKFNRIRNIQVKENKVFTTSELLDHIETGIKSGLYLYLRSISNDIAKGKITLPEEKSVANWYFVREFCYASMFRYNKQGEFNIPYGGIAYNKKNFRAKVNAILSRKVRDLLKNTFFYNADFQSFLEEASPTENDFVFLDPPYDSEFSEYDQNTFTKDDQVRLRDTILSCKAKCMVVIKKTDFIMSLYDTPDFTTIDFDKTYTYNVRGRNNRGTKHLIILNYDIIQQA